MGRLQSYTILPTHYYNLPKNMLCLLYQSIFKVMFLESFSSWPAASCLRIRSARNRKACLSIRGKLLSGGKPGPVEGLWHHPSGWLRKYMRKAGHPGSRCIDYNRPVRTASPAQIQDGVVVVRGVRDEEVRAWFELC